jgi:hypothetical protein
MEIPEKDPCGKCGRPVGNITVTRAHDAAIFCAECGLGELLDPNERPEYGGRITDAEE